MFLNRREMLAVLGSSSLMLLTGCKRKTVTKVIFVNNSNQPLTVNAVAGGEKFSKKNIRPGHDAKQTYRSDNKKGDQLPVTGSVSFKTVPGNIPIPPGYVVVAGKTNTITVSATIANGQFTNGPSVTTSVK